MIHRYFCWMSQPWESTRQSRNLIFDKIELLKKQGTTVVYTTHYMEEAQRLCDPRRDYRPRQDSRPRYR